MKNLITTAASIMVLLLLISAFSSSQIFFSRILVIDREAEAIGNLIKEKGYISSDEKSKSIRRLSKFLNCDSSEIEINCNDSNEEDPEKSETVDYFVQGPVGKMFNVKFIKDESLNKEETYKAVRSVRRKETEQ